MAEQTTTVETFRLVYERCSTKILAYCVRRVGPDAGHDALAETFLVAWRRRDELPSGDGELPYLYGIAGNVVSNLRRSGRRRSRLRARLEGLGVDIGPDASAYVIQSDRDRRVVEAVNKLKPTDREILMLYTWEDLPRQTIAEIMGLSKQAVDQRIHRSYKRLSRVLAPAMSGATISPRVAKKGGGA